MRHRTFYIVQLTLLIFLTPFFALAQSECSPIGYTVLTINGILTNESGAKANKDELELWLGKTFNNEPIFIDYLHNESHLGGAGDAVKVLKQLMAKGATIDDYDLRTLLADASDKVKTRKALLVGHSQGNFYANGIYDILTSPLPASPAGGEGGARRAGDVSVGVYSVATPASRVAGGGEYLTSENDFIITEVAAGVARAVGARMLPPNTAIPPVAGDTSRGHSFSGVYLAERGAEIVEGVEKELGKLRAKENTTTPSPFGRHPSSTEEGRQTRCIPAPKLTLAHAMKGALYAAADPAAAEVRDNLVTAGRNVAAAGRQVARAASAAARAVASVLESAPLVIEARDAGLPAGRQGAAVALATQHSDILQNVGISPEPPAPTIASLPVYTNVLQNTAIDTEVNERNNPEPGLSYAEVLENIRTILPSVSPLEGSTPTPVGGRDVSSQSGSGNPIYNPIPVPVGPGGFRGGGGGSPRAEVAPSVEPDSVEVATPAESESDDEEEEGNSTATPAPGTIVINELAWKGTIASADDEWVELYNTTSEEVSLASTTLLAAPPAGGGSPYIPLSGTIAGGGYFLIERKQIGETSEAAGSPLSDTAANLWTDFGTGLSDTGEVLTLAYFDGTATTTIDTAGFSDCADWCGKGGGANFVSMERIASSQSGTATASWLGNGGNTTGIRNGTARNGDIINGTPGAKNYASFLVNGGNNLTEGSLTLTATGSPYFVNSAWLTVGSGAALSIEAGAIVKFYNTAGIKVDGTLTISGTALNPAVLTSFFDDSYSGDTNRDGSTSSPQVGDWYGVEYRAGSSGSITGGLVRYGGKFFNGDSETRASIALTNASPSVSNSTLEYGSRYGLLLTNASSTISNNTFRNHTTTGDSYGIVGSGGAPTISSNTFSNNSVGLFFSDSSGTFSNNTFTNNTNGAFTFGGNLKGAGRISGNEGSGNGSYNGVRLPSGNLMYADTSSVFSKNASTFPYLLLNTSEVPVGATLTAEAGSIWKFDRSPFNIYGTLAVVGTAAENVIFSSIYDNESPVPIINNTGIVLQNGSVSDFTNATLRYMKVALSYDSAPLSLENVSLEGNALGISGTASTTITKALNVSFVDNTATSTISL